MKILVAHNLYRSSVPSGENAVYRAEIDLLRQHGHDVVTFERDNDNLDECSRLALMLRHAPGTLWSPTARRDLDRVLRQEKPDVAHFHNTFPQISPSAYRACRDAGVPVVQTVHNYRMACANGLFYRNGHICEECLEHGSQRAIVHRCYRDSTAQSAIVAAYQVMHRRLGTWQKIDAYIALTEFAKDKLVAMGAPEGRIHIKPNFLERPVEAEPRIGDYLIFVGKLDEYKGVSVLLEAHRQHMPSVPLHIVGTGPLAPEVQRADVHYHGLQPLERVLELLAGARALIMPSTWYETFGRTTMEAFALGKPVVASDLGCMRELVDDERTGLLFPTGDADKLATACKRLLEDDELATRLGHAARATYEARFTPERNHEMLTTVYEHVTARR